MPRAFSGDLRLRIQAAYERKYISQSALAQRFGVSYDYGKKSASSSCRQARWSVRRSSVVAASAG